MHSFYLLPTGERKILYSVSNNEAPFVYYVFTYHYIFDVACILRHVFDETCARHHLKWPKKLHGDSNQVPYECYAYTKKIQAVNIDKAAMGPPIVYFSAH